MLKLLDFESLDGSSSFCREDALRIGVAIATLELFGGWFTTFVRIRDYGDASTSGKNLLLARLRTVQQSGRRVR
jgi:hypothetical protein